MNNLNCRGILQSFPNGTVACLGHLILDNPISSNSNQINQTDHPCSVDGQADIYGIGIRVGLYIQWYCTTLAYLYDPDTVANIIIMNYSFSIAVAIAALVHRHEIYQHEVIIIAVLLMLPPTIVILMGMERLFLRFHARNAKPKYSPPNPSYRLRNYPADIAGILGTTFLLSMAVWELFQGVWVAQPAGKCWPIFIKAFYIQGRYEKVLKAAAIIFAIVAPAFLIYRMYKRMRYGIPEHDKSTTTQPILRFKVFGFELSRILVSGLWAIVASFVIAKIEIIISQNEIQGVMSPLQTGQIIPLVIGVLAFSIITYDVVRDSWERKENQENIEASQQTPPLTATGAGTQGQPHTPVPGPGSSLSVRGEPVQSLLIPGPPRSGIVQTKAYYGRSEIGQEVDGDA